VSKCTGCGADKPEDGEQWWHLRAYHSITGNFCSDCYDRVSHDSYGEPNRPNDYLLMLMKLGIDNRSK
jgi:hypothetical protein